MSFNQGNSSDLNNTAVGAFTTGSLLNNPEEVQNFENTVGEEAKKTMAGLVAQDPHLPGGIQGSIVNLLLGPAPISSILGGVSGAALSYSLAKFVNLKPETRNLLSLAGFGAGVIIAKTLEKTAPGTRLEHGNTYFLNH